MKDNAKYLFAYHSSVCCGNFGVLYVPDIEKVFSVRAAHYPVEDKTVLKGLSDSIALSFHEGVLYVAECIKNSL